VETGSRPKQLDRHLDGTSHPGVDGPGAQRRRSPALSGAALPRDMRLLWPFIAVPSRGGSVRRAGRSLQRDRPASCRAGRAKTQTRKARANLSGRTLTLVSGPCHDRRARRDTRCRATLFGACCCGPAHLRSHRASIVRPDERGGLGTFFGSGRGTSEARRLTARKPRIGAPAASH